MLTCFSVAAKAAQTRTHYVRDILLDGKQVQTVDGVTVTRGGSVAHALRVGEAVPDGTRIDVPARVSLVIASTGDKSTATLNPGASVTFVSTGSGEALGVTRGLRSSTSFRTPSISLASSPARRSRLRSTGRSFRSMQPPAVWRTRASGARSASKNTAISSSEESV